MKMIQNMEFQTILNVFKVILFSLIWLIRVVRLAVIMIYTHIYNPINYNYYIRLLYAIAVRAYIQIHLFNK